VPTLRCYPQVGSVHAGDQSAPLARETGAAHADTLSCARTSTPLARLGARETGGVVFRYSSFLRSPKRGCSASILTPRAALGARSRSRQGVHRQCSGPHVGKLTRLPLRPRLPCSSSPASATSPDHDAFARSRKSNEDVRRSVGRLRLELVEPLKARTSSSTTGCRGRLFIHVGTVARRGHCDIGRLLRRVLCGKTREPSSKPQSAQPRPALIPHQTSVSSWLIQLASRPARQGDYRLAAAITYLAPERPCFGKTPGTSARAYFALELTGANASSSPRAGGSGAALRRFKPPQTRWNRPRSRAWRRSVHDLEQSSRAIAVGSYLRISYRLVAHPTDEETRREYE